MQKVTINEWEFSIPENWNELTDAQLLAIAELVNQEQSHALIGLELLLNCAPFDVIDKTRTYQSGEQCYALKHKTETTDDILIQVSALAHLVQNGFKWLFTDGYDYDLKDFLFKVTSTLTRSPFKDSLELLLVGPNDGVANISFDEYIVANTMLDKYRQDPSDENLNTFCATLWRPKRQGSEAELLKYGDAREEFNDFVIVSQAASWSNINKKFKLVILWYYLGCMQELAKFKALQGHSKKSKEPVYIASAKLVDAIANGDVTKNAAVRKTYLYEVLIHLDRVIQQNEETEALITNKK